MSKWSRIKNNRLFTGDGLCSYFAALLMNALLPVNDAVAKDKKIEAYYAKGRRDPERDLVIRQGNVYRLDRQARVPYEEGCIRLKDAEEFDGQGR